MSDLTEKLAAPERTTDTRARARLYQLAQRWGCADIDLKRPPTFVLIRAMAGDERWRMVGPPSGKDTMYEQETE